MTRQVGRTNASVSKAVLEGAVEDLAHYARIRGLIAADELLTELLAAHRVAMLKALAPPELLTHGQRACNQPASTRGHGKGGSDDC
jgi:hypothetical protein